MDHSAGGLPNWRDSEQICEDGKDKRYVNEVDLSFANDFADAERHFRLYAANVFENIHFPGCGQLYLCRMLQTVWIDLTITVKQDGSAEV